MILVATPALIRDFSPQLGRASAMGFWTLGPVVGSLVVTEVASHTLDAHPDWQYQFRVCGIVGLVVFVIAFVGLRELAPRLRDQLMVSLRDRALIEARARGIDPEAATQGSLAADAARSTSSARRSRSASSCCSTTSRSACSWCSSRPSSATACPRRTASATGTGASQAIALIITGLLSDWLKVRKPFMVVGGLISAVGVALFAIATDAPGHDATTTSSGSSC